LPSSPLFSFSTLLPPPSPPLFPYTTLFRSLVLEFERAHRCRDQTRRQRDDTRAALAPGPGLALSDAHQLVFRIDVGHRRRHVAAVRTLDLVEQIGRERVRQHLQYGF